MKKTVRNTLLVATAGALILGLSACDLSKGNVEAPGMSSTSPSV